MSDTERFNKICSEYYVPMGLIIAMECENYTIKEKTDLLEFMANNGQLEKK